MVGVLAMLWLVVTLCLSGLAFAADNNLTKLVTWDNYSLSIQNQRTFIFAGEFHYQRLPVPELWPDIFQKFRAQGLNTVSIYFFWSYHSPSPGVYDFDTGAKNVQRLLDAAKEAGLWVIARPGPYCNAESNAGGLALWTTDGAWGNYRTGDEKYYNAWLPWTKAIGEILRRNQITNGGPVVLVQIENELDQTVYQKNHTLVKYMEQLKHSFRESGIVVPFTHNEKGMRRISWSTDYNNVGGAVNVYGLDSYPGSLSCTDPNKGFKLVRNYHEWFKNYSYTQPSFIPEFQAGWFQPHGGSFYDQCATELDPAFVDVYYKNNIGQRVTMMALYMAYGGTSWGHSAAPVVYTSYDYSAPLRETRQIRDKFKQTKLLALFTRVSKDLLKTDLVGSGRGYAKSTLDIWTWHLRNPDTGAGFYILQQSNSPSRSMRKTELAVQTSGGQIRVPEIVLDGRQSKIIVTDYKLSDKLTLLYSSVDVLTYGIFDRPVLVLYLKDGQRGDFAFKESSSFSKFTSHGSQLQVKTSSGPIERISWIQGKGYSVIDFHVDKSSSTSPPPLVYLLDIPSAWSFFAPSTTKSPFVDPNQQIFIIGPYLVRDAAIINDTLHIVGDHDLEVNQITIEAYVGKPQVQTISWNNQILKTSKTPYGALQAQLSNTNTNTRTISLPSLIQAEWRVADSLPEIGAGYDDSKWTVCDKTTTNSPTKPLSLPVLFSSDYGFYTGIKIYRGSFSSKVAKIANITVSGGDAFGWNAWLNGRFVGGNTGEKGEKDFKGTTWAMLELGNLKTAGGNVLTVVCDYHGHDETNVRPAGGRNPRGILGAKLYDEGRKEIKFKEWRIIGNAGAGRGMKNNIDPVRGPMNEGGLYGERMGWHLPGYDTSNWKMGTPMEGIKGAGVSWYITTFELDIGEGLDIPLGVEFSAVKDVPARIQMFINGYQYGRYIPHIGPQERFPIPPGIINNKGSNTLALSIWAQSDQGAQLSGIKLIVYGKYESGFKFNEDWSYLRPNWTSERLDYTASPIHRDTVRSDDSAFTGRFSVQDKIKHLIL